MERILETAVLACVLAHMPAVARAQAPTDATSSPPATAEARGLSTAAKLWTGDFDGMLERRAIRVLVPYRRSLYYSDRGRERGISAEGVRGFERWLNEKHEAQLRNRPITIVIIPTTRDRLLPDVASGRGDLAVGNLTVTDERLRLVDFVSDPDAPAVNEIVVTRRGAPLVTTPEGLAGKTVHVRRTSSYFESLVALNARLASTGVPP